MTLTDRKKVIQWMTGIKDCTELPYEVLFLAIDMMDRFTGIKKISIYKYQYVAVSCLDLANKFLLDTPISLKWEHLTKGACDKDNILRMNGIVLKALNLELIVPTSFTFFKKYGGDSNLTTLLNNIMSPKNFEHLPSKIAKMSLN